MEKRTSVLAAAFSRFHGDPIQPLSSCVYRRNRLAFVTAFLTEFLAVIFCIFNRFPTVFVAALDCVSDRVCRRIEQCF